MTDVDELTKIAEIAAKKFLERHGGDFDDAKSEVVVFLLSLDASDFSKRRAYYIKAGINRLVDNLRRERHTDWKRRPCFTSLTDVATDEDPTRAALTNENAQTIRQTLEKFGNPKGNALRDRKIVMKWLTKEKKQVDLAKENGVSTARICQIVTAFRRIAASNLRG